MQESVSDPHSLGRLGNLCYKTLTNHSSNLLHLPRPLLIKRPIRYLLQPGETVKQMMKGCTEKDLKHDLRKKCTKLVPIHCFSYFCTVYM